MKTFEQLTPEQQANAVKKCAGNLLEAIVSGSMRFNDKLNGDNFQARIDAALKKAEDMRTPWFASEYVMDTCRTEIEGMAQCDAEDAIYPEPSEYVLEGIA